VLSCWNTAEKLEFSGFATLKVLGTERAEVSLISRYILRETFGAWLIVVTVLFVIVMSNQFASILGDAAADRLPREAVMRVFGLTALRYFTILTPIALFLGVMLALARLNRDCEMAALSACGVGPGRLLAPVLSLTVALAAVLTWLSLFATPDASRQIDEIKFHAKEQMQLGALQSGKFTSPDAGDTVIYAAKVDGNQLRDVFVQRREGNRVVAILAERGERVVDSATGQISFVLHNGRRYEGVPGEGQFLVLSFDEQLMPVRRGDDDKFVEALTSKPTAELLGSTNSNDRAELEWRVSVPISLLILAVLAVPLSRSSPREGRYARIGVGLLLYVIYVNLVSIAYVWVQRDMVPHWVGMWWVHAAMFGYALLLVVRQSGVFRRPKLVARAVPA
jgi:lipopolysaccharide export system permease protein